MGVAQGQGGRWGQGVVVEPHIFQVSLACSDGAISAASTAKAKRGDKRSH